MTTRSTAFDDAKKFLSVQFPGMTPGMKPEVEASNALIEGRTLPKNEITTAAAVSGGPMGVAGVAADPDRKKTKLKKRKFTIDPAKMSESKDKVLEFCRARMRELEGIERKSVSNLDSKYIGSKMSAYKDCEKALQGSEPDTILAGNYSDAMMDLHRGGLEQGSFQQAVGKLHAFGEVLLELGASLEGDAEVEAPEQE